MDTSELKNLPVEIRLNHFRNIVTSASVDGKLEESERAVLGFVAQKWGLSQREVDAVYRDPDSIEAVITDDRTVCFHQLYDVVEMAIIDGQLKRSEKTFAIAIAQQLGYNEAAVDMVVQGILKGNQQGLTEAAIHQQLLAELK
jgi:uncharacterized tellurite resistance protein B-like protein